MSENKIEVEVKNEWISRALQLLAFYNGYTWPSCSKDLKYIKEKYLVFDKKSKLITYGYSDIYHDELTSIEEAVNFIQKKDEKESIPMKIAIEYIEWLQQERGSINRENIDNIEFFRNGMKFELSKDIMDEFKFSGLINTDILRFIE